MEVGNTAVARDALTNDPASADHLAKRGEGSPFGLVRTAAPTEAPSRVYKEALARLFKTLDSGERDIVASSVTITDERKQSMDFSRPYFDAVQLIAIKEDSKVSRFDDLKTLKVGVQTGTTGDEVVQKLLGKTNPNIRRFESTPLALQELAAGGVAAVVADNGVVQNYIINNPTAKFKSVSDASFMPEQYGFAVKKGNTELLEKINKGLDAIKADGTHDALLAKYFGPKPAATTAAPSTTTGSAPAK